MIKLHGFAVSNYYNMVKLALLEKQVPFEEVNATPSQEAAYKSKSPMGKIPCLETPQGFLSETSVILEYLEETHPTPALLPTDAYARAKARELARGIELYIELQARRHYGHVFFGGPKSQAAIEEVRPVVENGLTALRQLAHGQFLCGDRLTLADVVAYYTFPYAQMALKAVYGWDIVAGVPGLAERLARIGARATTQKVDADQKAAMAAFMAQKQAGG
ncbi:MAG: glutathione S-transferase family protein [Gammaproteobacteria bacterium]